MLTGVTPEQEHDRSDVSITVADDEVENDQCRTKAVCDGYSECLMERPECNHAKPFGYTSLCRHKCHREFRAIR